MLQPESTCLRIADISGYTGYLASAELDGSLMEASVEPELPEPQPKGALAAVASGNDN